MEAEDKRQLQWLYNLHKDKLTKKERALVLFTLDDWTVGDIAKFTRVEAPIIRYRLGRAVSKLW